MNPGTPFVIADTPAAIGGHCANILKVTKTFIENFLQLA